VHCIASNLAFGCVRSEERELSNVECQQKAIFFFFFCQVFIVCDKLVCMMMMMVLLMKRVIEPHIKLNPKIIFFLRISSPLSALTLFIVCDKMKGGEAYSVKKKYSLV
jgi:hypothetical protein